MNDLVLDNVTVILFAIAAVGMLGVVISLFQFYSTKR